MTAKEMFEKLRFEYSLSEDKTIIKYELGFQRIWFDKDFKDIVISGVYVIKQELLQAINKQVEELKW